MPVATSKVTREVSDEDDGSFVKSSGESSEDDEQEAVVDNVEVSPDMTSFLFNVHFIKAC